MYELGSVVEKAYQLRPKVTASCESVASRVVTPTRDELHPTVNKEVSVTVKGVRFRCNNCVSSCQLHAYESHRNTRWACKVPKNLKFSFSFIARYVIYKYINTYGTV